jgi:hypothetical protein
VVLVRPRGRPDRPWYLGVPTGLTLAPTSVANACSYSVDAYELENLRRSLAMLPPNAAGLSRGEAMRLLAELQEMDKTAS